MARKLAERTSCAVVLVDYRLAPEHRYPTAVDDCYAALEWTAARPRRDHRAAPTSPLIVAGDSAGGNLAAVVALRARDRNGPKIALQVLIYPVTDADFDRPSYVDPENQLVLTRDAMVWFWDHYVPDAARRTEPDASPLRAADLDRPAARRRPHRRARRAARRGRGLRRAAAGGRACPSTSRRHAGQMHGFFTFLLLPGSERGFQQVVKAVQACTVRHARDSRHHRPADHRHPSTEQGDPTWPQPRRPGTSTPSSSAPASPAST